MFAEIAIPINHPKTFTYQIHENLNPQIGQRVLVPFQYKLRTGIIVSFPETISFDPAKIKDVAEIIDDEPLVTAELLELARWISKYYFCPLGIVLKAMLPAGCKVESISKVSLKKSDTNNPNFHKLISFLQEKGTPVSISGLKNLNINSIFKTVLEMEEKGLIEIERSYKRKDPTRVENFIKIIGIPEGIKLTSRQSELYELLKKKNKPIAVRDIKGRFAYTIIKKLEEKKLVKKIKKKVQTNFFEHIEKIPAIVYDLTTQQLQVMEQIGEAIASEKYQTFLLHGVTASGKTEIYIRSMKDVIARGKKAILLIPEIALTPQTVERFYAHFGDDVAVLHSRQSDRERYYFWKAIRDNKKKIVIGPRSVIFAPLPNIGLIIVDEEHENSYKQSGQNPVYNGRDMAVLRGRMNDALVILGSATPNLETYFNVLKNKYKLLEMTKKVKNQFKPEFQIVDMKREKDHTEIFSQDLKNAIEDRLNKKEQIILFQNRRGYASYVQCVKCGYVFQCTDCNISLTYHAHKRSVVCHYCGKSNPMPQKCPKCGSRIFNFGSPGTEKIEQNLTYLFPKARIARMDRDTTTKKDSHQIIFTKVKNQYIDILLGTQMIIKGLDFPNVTLVGIISADVNLNLPDFRAAERNFQHITQVAGRTGRSEKKGKVILQTYNPNHYSIQYGKTQDFKAFFDYEISLREKLHYPPYTKLVRLLFQMGDEEKLKEVVYKARRDLKKYDNSNQIIILGPVTAPITKIRKQFRYHIVVKAFSTHAVFDFISWFKKNIKIPNYIKLTIDVDPVSLL
ncbi:MAG: primosomal protein N' [Candidatus Cloacimonadota bacterium]|nr:primosomal protein N' [Candidatus Cloacimonadota bacterium]